MVTTTKALRSGRPDIGSHTQPVRRSEAKPTLHPAHEKLLATLYDAQGDCFKAEDAHGRRCWCDICRAIRCIRRIFFRCYAHLEEATLKAKNPGRPTGPSTSGHPRNAIAHERLYLKYCVELCVRRAAAASQTEACR
jgi:hypothetical protein